jgi:glycosyltransferase involved in cell wall biosynthesis
MRVALVVDELPTSAAPKILGEEAYHLERLGIKADVVVMKRKIREAPLAHEDSVKKIYLDASLRHHHLFQYRIPGFSFFSLYHVFYPYILSSTTKKILEQYDAVVIHYSSTALLVRRLGLRKTIYYLWDPVSYIFSVAYHGWSATWKRSLLGVAVQLDRILIESFDIIVLPSRFHMKRVKDLGARNIRIIYPGVHNAKFLPERRGDYMISVARWEPGKNPYFLLDLSKELINRGFRDLKIRMVGPWKSEELLRSFLVKAKRLGVRDNLEILGPKYGEALNSLYLGAKALIHPKIKAFGFTGLEAAAHGCPIIFPRGSGVTELFEDRMHGCFPKEGDINGFAECAEQLLNNEDKALTMGRKAWEIAKKRSWDRHVEELIEVLINGI